jgi:hypothetical protein
MKAMASSTASSYRLRAVLSVTLSVDSGMGGSPDRSVDSLFDDEQGRGGLVRPKDRYIQGHALR